VKGAQRKATLAERSSEGKFKRKFSILNDQFAAKLQANDRQLQAIKFKRLMRWPPNSNLGGRHSIVSRPTAIIAAALWPHPPPLRASPPTSRVLL